MVVLCADLKDSFSPESQRATVTVTMITNILGQPSQIFLHWLLLI